AGALAPVGDDAGRCRFGPRARGGVGHGIGFGFGADRLLLARPGSSGAAAVPARRRVGRGSGPGASRVGARGRAGRGARRRDARGV
ncbi:MAG: hypothetical protein AVDCRST_MAG73-3532, partial [uncultured Thermomicrobiales bacterium]